MVDLEGVVLPDAIRDAVAALEEDVDLTRYSDKGANGYLFFGRHRILESDVAVKFYYWQGGRHDEPRILAQVDHSNVMPVLSARFVDAEWAMFQTPYYPRGDIDQVISRGVLSLHQALDHAVEVLAGLSALHALRLVHRDLKAENIFIDRDGQARIGDFGSVRALPAGGSDVVGSSHSVLYRPPEAFATGRYSPLGDIYQTGILLYQLAGGNLPYDEAHWLDREGLRCYERAEGDAVAMSACVSGSIERRVRREHLLDMDSLPPTVPPALKRAIRKTTRSEPDRRFASPAHLMNELVSLRGRCLDWRWENRIGTATTGDRDVRIVPARAERYRAEFNKRGGAGWRKIVGLNQGTAETLARAVEVRIA